MNQRIPVFTDDPGWHGQQLKAAFAARGRETLFLSLRSCHMDFRPGGPHITLPGFSDGSLPEGVFVRGVPGGTLQQVIARLDILHMLGMQGVLVYNEGKMLERTVDKAMTSFLLCHHGIPTPPTWVCESRAQAEAITVREAAAGHGVVLKPLFGSQGQGLRRLVAGSSFPVPMEAHVDGLYYMQRYVDSGEGAWHDYRVFVIRHKVAGAMVRRGGSWINNVAQGARCEALAPSPELARLALAAAQAVEADYCGVDIIRDAQGDLFVLEVNGIPAWKGLQGVAGNNIAQMLADDFLDKLGRKCVAPPAMWHEARSG